MAGIEQRNCVRLVEAGEEEEIRRLSELERDVIVAGDFDGGGHNGDAALDGCSELVSAVGEAFHATSLGRSRIERKSAARRWQRRRRRITEHQASTEPAFERHE